MHRSNVISEKMVPAQLVMTCSSSNCPCSWHTANQHESYQSTCNNQSASLPTPDSLTTLCRNVTIAQHLDVTEWLLPSYICQSSIGGRPSGSNTCTVIAVLAALDYLEGTLQIPMQLQDLNITIPMYTNVMIIGNHLYDSFNLPVQQPNLEVRQVLQHGKNDKHLKKLEITSDLGFFTVKDLGDHFMPHHHNHYASIVCSCIDCATRQVNGTLF